MKISYRTHPILEKLYQVNFGNLIIFPCDMQIHGGPVEALIRFIWNHSKTAFKENIYMVSLPFIDATNKSYGKLYDLYTGITDLNINGTFISGDWVNCIHYELTKEMGRWAFLQFHKSGRITALIWNDSSEKRISWISYDYFKGAVNQQQILEISNSQMAACIYIYLFKHYAEVETKILPPNKRIKGFNCKYANDTKLPITFLDSKWFTNLIQSNAFKVGGHFRQQACGSMFQDRKIIWISEFQKSGYHSRAKILYNQNPLG
jgi:hypothetical protein